MEEYKIPKPGEIFNRVKGEPFQIITVAVHTETSERMVVYQALYGDFKTYIKPLDIFMSEIDRNQSPEAGKQYNFAVSENTSSIVETAFVPEEGVNSILMEFLDAASYSKKLDILTSNMKHMNDRLINDMAVALDCSIDEGPLDQRIKSLMICLQAMRRFEDRRLR